MYSHFEYFGLEPHFIIDESLLRKEYMRIQKEWHPDFHASNPSKLEESIVETSKNNAAYNALKTFEGRVQYILAELGLLNEGEKNMLPPSFLADMLDIHDLINEALGGNTQSGTEANLLLAEFENHTHSAMLNFTQNADNEQDKWSATYMQPLKEEFQKYRYLLRLRKNLAGERDL